MRDASEVLYKVFLEKRKIEERKVRLSCHLNNDDINRALNKLYSQGKIDRILEDGRAYWVAIL